MKNVEISNKVYKNDKNTVVISKSFNGKGIFLSDVYIRKDSFKKFIVNHREAMPSEYTLIGQCIYINK